MTNGQPRNTTCVRITNGSRTRCHLPSCFNPRAPWGTTAQKFECKNLFAEFSKKHPGSSANVRGFALGRVHKRPKRLLQTYHPPPCVLPPKPLPCPEREPFPNRQANVLPLESNPAMADSGLGIAFAGDVPTYSQPIPFPEKYQPTRQVSV